MKLIDKSALVAEIERRLWLLVPKMTFYQQWVELEKLISFIDSLEVKEVDLDKEIDDYINEHFSECDDGVLISDANSTELTLLDVASIARHFFELGMQVSNKAQKGEEV